VNYNKNDIIQSLVSSGIRSGDSVFFTTSLGMVGIPPKEINSSEKLNALFIDAISEVIKDGNIIVPTYSYTFGASTATELKIFDLKKTKSEIGPFPNYVLSRSDFIRSADPFVSVACKGKDCNILLSGLSNSSYGKGSFFSKMVELRNMKCCSIGLGPNWMPFIHYADWLEKVPFRYDKNFYGYIKSKDKLEFKEWIYSVPCLLPEALSNAHKIGRLAEKEGIWNSSKLGRARIYTSNCKEYFDFVMKYLKRDQWLLAKGPKVDVNKAESERIQDGRDVVEVSLPYKITKYKTGEWLKGWLVPEKWICHDAKLLDSKGNVLSTTSYDYSLSIDKIVDLNTLKKHISPIIKNVYANRDWGFVYDKELNDDVYTVKIDSSFGFGEISFFKKDNTQYAILNNRPVKVPI
jgi:aminoglycoside N3'-acetyltransferase